MVKLIVGAKAVGRAVFLLTAAPLLLPLAFAGLWVADRWASLSRPRSLPDDKPASTRAVSVVIPTWNGRDLLARNLPHVLAALGDASQHEVIVVDNASTDGTTDFLESRFPQITVLALNENLGFGGGSNAGIRRAANDIVLLLNNDMRPEPGFLEPLLEGFSDPRVFAVTAQIHFSDPDKRREETGLVQGSWVNGSLHVAHRDDDQVNTLFPTFYAGGGSTAYDRRKFLELGGFDALLEPFYFEDTDVSYMAWKRGWVILYQPRSIVYHEHRATIGKNFPTAYIDAVFEKNRLLFVWKNIHEARRLAEHFFWTYAGMWVRLLLGPTPTRPAPRSVLRALRQFPALLKSRRRALHLATVDDTEAFRRPLGGYFRDRFGKVAPEGRELNVLFVSPYPIEPPIHGGGVFMNQTVRHLARLSRLHLLCLLDEPDDLATNQTLRDVCVGTEFMVRWREPSMGIGSLSPHAARMFYHPDLLWKIHRTIFQHEIDVLQLDYTQLATYAPDFRQIGSFLFEHDVFFQSILRSMKRQRSVAGWLQYGHEYLRALRFERRALTRFDAAQACTAANRHYIESFVWNGAPVVEGLRAGIDVERYRYIEDGREPNTVLFVGNFRHLPNQDGLRFFIRKIWPRVMEKRPQSRLVVVGAQAPPAFRNSLRQPGVEFQGRVDDIREPFERYAVFVCPVLVGSGVRVKLLEAFAAGIPVVSTSLGAEGLTNGRPSNGEASLFEQADKPDDFADRVLALLGDPARGRELARRARREVEEKWNMATNTVRLERHYREVLREKQSKPGAAPRTLRLGGTKAVA